MPKSSIEMRTPSARSACSVASTWLLFLQQQGLGDFQFEPLGRQAGLLQRIHHDRQQIAGAELQRRQVDGDADVVGPASPRPRRRGAASIRRAALIRPVSSATGMNSAGETMPRSGCGQRTSASKPVMRPVERSISG